MRLLVPQGLNQLKAFFAVTHRGSTKPVSRRCLGLVPTFTGSPSKAPRAWFCPCFSCSPSERRGTHQPRPCRRELGPPACLWEGRSGGSRLWGTGAASSLLRRGALDGVKALVWVYMANKALSVAGRWLGRNTHRDAGWDCSANCFPGALPQMGKEREFRNKKNLRNNNLQINLPSLCPHFLWGVVFFQGISHLKNL